MPRFGALDDYLDHEELDGYLLDADGTVGDQRYLSGYDAPDPFQTLYRPAGISLLVRGLEYGRAREESAASSVRRPIDYGVEPGSGVEASYDALASFLAEFEAESVAVPPQFPVGTADALRQRGLTVEIDRKGIIGSLRAVKSAEEIDEIRAAQRANEAALRAAEQAIADASVEGEWLVADAEPLTAEHVKAAIEVELLEHGYALDETIVAGGEQGADPHERGSGPLPANEPIIVDVFPRSKRTRYHADMTRTFVRGEPSEEVRRRHEVTCTAMEAAFDAIEPGAAAETIHDAVCDVYEAAGYTTLRSDPSTETGFIHSTGHGVGLDVHERPRVGPGGDELEPGNVVTIEPGLYDPAVGGVRVEDLVVVTDDGYENLTTYPTELVVGG